MTLPTTANTSNPQGFGFGARLDDLLLRLAEAPGRELTVQDAEMEADRVNTAQTPEAYLSAFGDVFARSAFWGGEGLLWAHRRDNLVNHEARFWASSRIDISRPRDRPNPGVELSPAVASLGETWEQFRYHPKKDAGHNGSLIWDMGKLYIGRADGYYRVSTDPLAATPTFSYEDPYAGEAISSGTHSTTFLGQDVYAALRGNGIHRDQNSAGNNWAHWNDLDADIVWGLKRRILARGGGVAGENLYEVTSGGAAPAALKTLDSGTDWQDATDAGEAILACATDGGIYSFALNDSDTLVLQGETHLPHEIPDAIHATRGLVFYVTRRQEDDVNGKRTVASLWQAELSSALTLANQQLIRTWGRTNEAGLPYVISESDDALFFSVEDEGATSTSLWRYDLSTGAISRHLIFPDADYVAGVTLVRGRILAMKDSASGDGNTTQNELFREEASYASAGHLIGPLGDLFTADEKSWVTAKLDAAGLNGNGEQVDFYLTTNLDALDDPDHADWVLIKSYTSSDDSEVAVSRFSRYIAGMVKLTPSTDGTNTPVVRSFAFRSYPPPGDILVDLPVNVSDQISSAGRRPRRVPGRGKEVFNELLSRSGREATLELYRHGITVTGLVERVSVPSPEVGEAGSPTDHAMLRFRGRKATLVQS